MTDLLEQQLKAINNNNQPNIIFADELEQQLRVIHMSQKQHRQPSSNRSNRVYFKMGGLVASLIIVIGLFAFTSLRSMAEEFLQSLFISADSTVIVVTEPAGYSNPTNPIALTIAQVQKLTNFDIKVPTYPLPDYEFIGADYSEARNAVNLLYETDGRTLIITQQKLADSEQYLLTDSTLGVGAGTPIEEVNVGQYHGVFVAGMWIETNVSGTNGSNTTELTWMPSAPRRRLRWIEDTIVYEIFVQGGSEGHGFIGQNEMITIANSLQ